MTPFRFPLQKVLELREQQEKEKAVGLAQAQQQASVAKEARTDLEAVREAGRVGLARAHGQGGAVGHLQNMSYVVESLDERIQEAESVCEEADDEVVRSMKTFHEAVKQRRTIDTLKERRLGEWRTDEARAETKTMDEIAVTRHGRNGNRVDPRRD
jgi:flagellar FliJ protein